MLNTFGARLSSLLFGKSSYDGKEDKDKNNMDTFNGTGCLWNLYILFTDMDVQIFNITSLDCHSRSKMRKLNCWERM